MKNSQHTETFTPTANNNQANSSEVTAPSAQVDQTNTPVDSEEINLRTTNTSPGFEISFGPFTLVFDPMNNYHQSIILGMASILVIARLLLDQKII
jgi:hypothetical protein